MQYFIWSTDNIGILASEALLRAAERGVKVRVIVDDLLIDAPPDSMLALALHPNIDIRIYNPRLNVGTSKLKKISNVATGLRSVNQRMHDKTALFDGRAGITGGRNMADEYFDYNHSYNFRDRDVLVLGPAVVDMQASFQRFWDSPQAVPVEKLLTKEMKRMTPERAGQVYAGLHAYAAKSENFAPEVRQALEDLPGKFERLSREIIWDEVRFLSDLPGKNSARYRFDGGGRTTAALADELKKARTSVTIQSPYLVMPTGALEIFRTLVQRGVRVRIVTNSLASTDNLQAFSGYQKQRRAILKSGVQVYEFKPDPAIRRELIERYPKLEKQSPVFAIHAQEHGHRQRDTLRRHLRISIPARPDLNTEVGVPDPQPPPGRAGIERTILRDMDPANSWSAADNPGPLRAARKASQTAALEGAAAGTVSVIHPDTFKVDTMPSDASHARTFLERLFKGHSQDELFKRLEPHHEQPAQACAGGRPDHPRDRRAAAGAADQRPAGSARDPAERSRSRADGLLQPQYRKTSSA